MYSKSFNTAFELLMIDEGGFVNDPADPGGATNYGITKSTLESYLQRKVTVDEIQAISKNVAKEIYFKNYWRPLSCEEITNEAIAICLFNTGVLHGIIASGKAAQQSLVNLGITVRVDGIIGNATVSQLNKVDTKLFLKAFHKIILERIAVLIFKNPDLKRFEKGWTRRTDKLLALSDKNNRIV
jgi:peptidoglycan L-alanyl-D-glutamate endopeptidase CwlK